MLYLLYLIVFSIPWLAISPRKEILGVPGGAVFVGLVMLFVIGRVILSPEILAWQRIKNTKLMIPLMIFLAANLASLLRIFILQGAEGFWTNNFFEVGYLFFAVLFFWSVLGFIDSDEKYRGVINIFLLTALISCLYGVGSLILYMTGSPYGEAQFWTVPRLLSPGTESQVTGGFIITLLPLALAVLLYRIPRYNFNFSFISVSVLMPALIMTFSAGAWAGFAVALLILLIFFRFYNVKRLLAVLLSFALTASIIITIDRTVYPGYLKGFESITKKFTWTAMSENKNHAESPVMPDNSQSAAVKKAVPEQIVPRKDVPGEAVPVISTSESKIDPSVFSGVERSWFRAALWKMFRSSPILGIGPGNFERLYSDYRPAESYEPSFVPKPHNQYLEILAETGVVGFLSFLAVILALLRVITYSWLESPPETRKILTGLTASLVAVGVHGYVFGILVHVQIWLLAALITAVADARDNTNLAGRIWRGDRL